MNIGKITNRILEGRKLVEATAYRDEAMDFYKAAVNYMRKDKDVKVIINDDDLEAGEIVVDAKLDNKTYVRVTFYLVDEEYVILAVDGMNKAMFSSSSHAFVTLDSFRKVFQDHLDYCKENA